MIAPGRWPALVGWICRGVVPIVRTEPMLRGRRNVPAPGRNDLAMGVYDREYYRGEEPGGTAVAGPRSMVTNLVILNVVLYVLDIFIDSRHHWLMEHMAASPASVAQPWLWWQLITYGFAHSYQDQWHIISNMFGLWMFGRDVEGVYGRWEFLRIYLVAVFWGASSGRLGPASRWILSCGTSTRCWELRGP